MDALRDIEAVGFNQHGPSLMDNLKNLNFRGVLDNINAYHFNWAHMGLFAAIGFFSGLLCKKYLKMFLISLFVGALLIGALEYFFHIIHWDALNNLIGNDPAQAVTNFMHGIVAYAQQNVSLMICLIIGFFIGYQVS